MRRDVRIDHQDIGLRADQRDRREVLLGAVVEMFVQRFIGGEDAVVAHQQRVAVRRRMRDGFGRDDCRRRPAGSRSRTATPSNCSIFLPTMRASTSLGPPGVNATTKRDGAARIVRRAHRWADCKQGCNAKEGGPNPDRQKGHTDRSQ